MRWLCLALFLSCLIINIYSDDLHFELRGPLEKVIKQTEAELYQEDGWVVLDSLDRNLKVDYQIPEELTKGIVNTDENPAYIIKYYVTDKSTNQVIALRERKVIVEDINECELGTHNCHKNAYCENTIGSFVCHCKPGYEGDGRVCTEIDYCSKFAHTCPPHSRCENREGTHACICNNGFKIVDGRCVHINECEEGTHKCKNAECINTEGGYYCKCFEGFITRDRYTCELENVCENGKLLCSAYGECYYDRDNNKYDCKCNPGFVGNGRECFDFDECGNRTYSCPEHSNCINTFGAYKCDCKQGFEKINGLCVDINECERHMYWCHEKARCKNTIGGYTCECIEGYEGDGKTCRSTEKTKFKLNGDNPLELLLGGNYIEYGYQITDPSGQLLEITAVPSPELRGKLSTCGTFKVEYQVVDPNQPDEVIPSTNRTVNVRGIDLCATSDKDLAKVCPAFSKCIPDVKGCTASCKCNEGYKLENGICIDARPPVVICPSEPIVIKQCFVCDERIGSIRPEEEKNRKRCVAYDMLPDSKPVDNAYIQRQINEIPDPSVVRLPNDVVDLTDAIDPPIEVEFNKTCKKYVYKVRDMAGNEGKGEVIVCTNVVDMKSMKEEMDNMINNYGWYIRFLGVSIIATIIWLLFLAFNEFSKQIFYFVQVIIFRDTSSYERCNIAYSFWYKLLHPFATEKEVKKYVNQRLLDDEGNSNEDDDEEDEEEEEEEEDNQGEDEDDEEEEEEEEEEERRRCLIM